MASHRLAPFGAVLSLLFVVVVYGADPLAQDSRPTISCFRCIPSQANSFCADNQAEASKADCTAGRCIMMAAKFTGGNDVARLYDCDSANIVSWAFQLFADQNDDELPPNTCKLLDFGSPGVIDTFRNYGMSAAITALLRTTASGAELENQVEKVELCTCEDSQCNSVQTNQQISVIPRGGDRPVPPGPRPPQPPGPTPAPDCGLPWYWVLLIVLWSLLLLLLLATLGLWLYKRSKKPKRHFDANRDEYRRPENPRDDRRPHPPRPQE